MQKESQEQEKPRQEEPQQVCLRLFSCCGMDLAYTAVRVSIWLQEAINLLIPLAVIVWFEMASTLIDRFRPASSL